MGPTHFEVGVTESQSRVVVLRRSRNLVGYFMLAVRKFYVRGYFHYCLPN